MSRPTAREPAHPTPRTYIKVAAALGIVTGVEVWVFFIEQLEAAFVPIFLVLSAFKFVLVAMFYMHLKFDSRLFSGLFVGGLMVAAAIIVSLLGLFQILRETPTTTEAVVVTTEVPPPDDTGPPAPTTKELTPSPEISPEQGMQVFLAKGCAGCHAIDGVPGAVGIVGPKLNGVATRAATRKPGLSAEEYIQESIEDPNAFVVEGFQPLMLDLREAMTNQEFQQLVAYLLTLE